MEPENRPLCKRYPPLFFEETYKFAADVSLNSACVDPISTWQICLAIHVFHGSHFFTFLKLILLFSWLVDRKFEAMEHMASPYGSEKHNPFCRTSPNKYKEKRVWRVKGSHMFNSENQKVLRFLIIYLNPPKVSIGKPVGLPKATRYIPWAGCLNKDPKELFLL